MEMPCSAHIEPEEAPTRSDERDDNGQIQDVCALSEWEDTIDNDGNTCLHLMARQKMLNKVKLAPEGKVWNALVNHKNKDGHTPLHISCIKRDRASARILLDNGADINATDMLGL